MVRYEFYEPYRKLPNGIRLAIHSMLRLEVTETKRGTQKRAPLFISNLLHRFGFRFFNFIRLGEVVLFPFLFFRQVRVIVGTGTGFQSGFEELPCP